MITRSTYAETRFEQLSSIIAVRDCVGLELGACDLPTVRPWQGVCHYADFRAADEMCAMWGLSAEDVCTVDYVISRDLPLPKQIDVRFDYVIACHVIEHVPDVITYINDLRVLLKPGPGRVIFLTLPDKRATPDATRPSTTLDHLVMDHYDQCRYPTIEHILEFHRHWLGHEKGTDPISVAEAYPYAISSFESGMADAHCHVWTGEEFRAQVEALIEANLLPDLELAFFEPMKLLNEFCLALKTTDRLSSAI